MTDPITDMLNRIRNAQAVLLPTVKVPFSNLKYEIAKVLEKHGFVGKLERRGRKTKRVICIDLKYKDKTPLISGLKRISKPGQRIYGTAGEIKAVDRGGRGGVIVSTSKGLMMGREARAQKLGGEIIAEIW